ncbi:uncharacterized protein LOC131597868 [Vicia villosa]|uniref:uncharacterized protein LOC131597868 n=1 Tax=Vicia villosa TaxID=3911 RepID=UPI00273BA70F|nr:uncharacterized protein LOC131597868 [Vicia villosa]
MKKNVVLDNRFVIPYNPYLLKKFQAHINMEWCNQGTSVKYLFKYINKGYDIITAVVVEGDTDETSFTKNVDEIKQYLDCRYVSPSEACWRIFSFPIHGRSPAVERLYFHLEGDNSVYYTDYELIDEVLEKPSVKESMFIAWMEANKTYPEATKKRPCHWKTYSGMMLTVAKGPTCYEDIKKVSGIIRESFRDACFEMGFVNDDKEYVAVANEAKDWGSGQFLRKLFVTMLLSGTINRPRHVWEKTWKTLSDDEQHSIFETIMEVVRKQRGGVFVLHGYGGTGKTFMWRTLSSALRSKKKIVLTVASSGIASLLFPGGRTSHLKFKIHVPTLENSTCNVDKNIKHSQLFEATDVIIWDEAPMAHKNLFEALDKTLKDVMSKKGLGNKIFGGKVVVFGGDFRQILPVVPRAERSDIVHALIFSSYIWDYCQVLTLTKNMRLQQGRDGTSSKEIAEFSKWILNVGDDKISEPNDGLVDIKISPELLITNFEDPIKAIVESTYPNLVHVFQDVAYLQGKAIIASTIEVVDKISHYVLDLIPGEGKEYLSYDSIDRTDTSYTEAYEVLSLEFLSKLRISSLPNHKIKWKLVCDTGVDID